MIKSSTKDFKAYPTLFIEKEDCCGCTACFNVCPKTAITMTQDEQGFYYPVINKEKCIKCYQCVGVCPNRSLK